MSTTYPITRRIWSSELIADLGGEANLAAFGSALV